MPQLNIRSLAPDEPLPMELLLCADPSDALILSYINQSHTFVAENGHAVVGVLVLQLKDETAEIMNVAVQENQQGQGIGRQLVEHAVAEVRKQGIKQLTVCTGNSSLPALALYKACGFKVTGIHKDYFLRHYSEPIFEHGIQCTDRIKLRLEP